MARVKIEKIVPGMRNLKVVGRVVRIGQRKKVETRFGPAHVAAALLQDETGTIRLNLWRWQIDVVREGDLIMLVNAFARSFGGKTELNVGRDGRIIVLERRGDSRAQEL